jgi:adenylate cyclase
VRKAGQRVRISAQLIDASTGQHIWAERYDRELQDIFALQDEITEAIVASMNPELSRFERDRVARQERPDLDAWESLYRGAWHIYRFTKEDNEKARLLFEKTAELDPRLSRAFAALATTYWVAILNQWTDSPARSIAELEQAARKAVTLDDKEPMAHIALAFAYGLTEQGDKAAAASKLAVELNPSFATACAWHGVFLARAGRAEEAIDSINKAMRLSPQDPMIWFFHQAMALAHFTAGQYEHTVEWAQRTLQRKPDLAITYRLLAASYGQLGRIDEAKRALDQALRLTPEFSLSAVRLIAGSADPGFRERLIDSLRKAGLKEE